ncbi:MAG: tetratricopeptide repeat protein [Candidatus Omnitrophota bacterium]
MINIVSNKLRFLVRARAVFLVVLSCFTVVFNVYADFDKQQEDAFYVAAKAYEDSFYDVSITLFERFLKNYFQSNKKSEALLYIGQCYYAQGKYMKALNQFESLLDSEGIEPIKDKVLFWLGEVYFKGRDYRRAGEFYKQVIDHYKNSHYFVLAYKALAQAQIDDGKFQEALETYNQILSITHDPLVNQEAFFGICESLYRMKDFSRLRKELEDFIKKYPQSMILGRAFFYLGEADFYLGQYEEAIQAYQSVGEFSSDPQQISLARLGIGWSFLKQKKYKQAKELFSLFENELQSPGIVLGKAVLETGLGNYEEALKLFDDVIAIDKAQEYIPLAFFGKAEVLYNLFRLDEAIVAYRTALDKLKVISSGAYTQVKDLRDKIHYGLAWSYLKIGDFQSAQNEFQRVASFSTDKIVKISALCQLGDAFQDAGEYDKAIQTYQNFIKDYPDTVYSDYIQYQLGMTWLKMKNLDSAVLAFRRLLKDYPSSKLIDDVNYFIGICYFQKGAYAVAAEQLQLFVNGFKDSSYRSQALFLLGESYMNAIQYKEAINIFGLIAKEYADAQMLRQKAEYEIANAYERLGDDAQASRRLMDFITRYPDSQLTPDIIFWLAQSCCDKKNFSQGRKYFERLIRSYPDHELAPDAFLQIGISYLEEGKTESAVRSFQQAKQNGNDQIKARASLSLGEVYFTKSELGKALGQYEEAAALGDDMKKPAFLKISQVYRLQGKLAESIAVLQQALNRDGGVSDAEIQFNIAELLEEKGDSQEALEAYLKATYLYSDDKTWVVKALLRVARIYETQEKWTEVESILKKILEFDVPEVKYAQEKLQWLSELGLKDRIEME